MSQVRGLVVLGACAGVLCGSSSARAEAEPTTSDAAGAPSSADRAVAYWMGQWGAQPHDEPMYLRLPVGVDTRSWGPMHEGYVDWLQGQKGFNRPAKLHYQKDYDFTWDVFSWSIPLWRRVLEPFAGRPDVHYLENGIAEGRAILWMLEAPRILLESRPVPARRRIPLRMEQQSTAPRRYEEDDSAFGVGAHGSAGDPESVSWHFWTETAAG